MSFPWLKIINDEVGLGTHAEKKTLLKPREEVLTHESSAVELVAVVVVYDSYRHRKSRGQISWRRRMRSRRNACDYLDARVRVASERVF